MKTLRSLTLVIIALFSQLVLAGEWRHIEFRQNENYVRLSYTQDWLPATYGSNGGMVNGLFYTDIHSSRALNVSRAEIFKIESDGRLSKISTLRFAENNPNHFYAKKDREVTYADFLWAKENYKLKIEVNGEEIEFNFKLR